MKLQIITPEWDKALDETIKGKWTHLTTCYRVRLGVPPCPMCEEGRRLRNLGRCLDMCSLCPICRDTGKLACLGTPHLAWLHHLNKLKLWPDGKRNTVKLKRLAQAELDYLIELRKNRCEVDFSE